MDPGTCHALALCLIYDQPPSRCAALLLLDRDGQDQPEGRGGPRGDVRLVRHPQAGDPAARAELHRQGADQVLAIPDSFMSSQHAVLRRDRQGLLRAEDLGSKNGTRLCGVPLRHGSRPLRHGDELEAGRALLRLLVLEGAGSARWKDDERDRVYAEEPLQLAPGWPGTLSPGLRRVYAALHRLPGAEVPVLIQGEPGTGKRALGQHLHDRLAAGPGGLRGPLLRVPPGGALPLRELQGAAGVTLLVENVERLTQAAQLDLLRLLRGEPRRRGPLQLIATTDIDLGVLCRGGAFRPDLLVHLSAVTLHLPPLRERKEDLGLLAEHYLGRLADGAAPAERRPDGAPGEGRGARAGRLGIEAWRRLFAYDFPGNQAELRAVLAEALRRARAAGRGEIEPADLPDRIQHGFSDPVLPGLGPPLPCVPVLGERPEEARPQADRESRREALIQALQAEDGKVARAARRLGLSRVHVHRLARQLGIDLEQFRVRRTTRKL